MAEIELATKGFASKDWFPIRPRCQLSSIKRRIDDWSGSV